MGLGLFMAEILKYSQGVVWEGQVLVHSMGGGNLDSDFYFFLVGFFWVKFLW